MGVKAIAERPCSETGKRTEWPYHSFISSSLTGDHNPPSFNGPATMRDNSAISCNFDRRQSFSFPESVYLSCIPQRINCRKGQGKTVGVRGETLPFLGSRRRGFSLAKQRGAAAPRGPNRERVGAPDSCSSEKPSDRKM